jgi:hypothetical protein
MSTEQTLAGAIASKDEILRWADSVMTDLGNIRVEPSIDPAVDYEVNVYELKSEPRTYEERQADRLANMLKRRHFQHMITHGMSSMPRHVRLRAVRGGCFVDVFYTYAFIQMPFNSIRLARKYVKYMGLPLHTGEEK